jgi:hypothetical protein
VKNDVGCTAGFPLLTFLSCSFMHTVHCTVKSNQVDYPSHTIPVLDPDLLSLGWNRGSLLNPDHRSRSRSKIQDLFTES